MFARRCWFFFLSVLFFFVLAPKVVVGVEGRVPIFVAPPDTFHVQGPGSYILTTDLNYNGYNVDIISIESGGVTLDLGGHQIVTDSTTAKIIKAIDQSDVRIMNGKLLGGAFGIYFTHGTAGAITVQIDSVTVAGQSDSAGNAGILVGGNASGPISAVITNNNVGCFSKVSLNGIALGNLNDSRVERNVVFGCKAGIDFLTEGFKINIEGNTLSGNTNGITSTTIPGIRSSAVRYNLASGNSSNGMRICGNSNSVDYNTVSENPGGYGLIICGNYNAVRYNTASANGADGIFLEYNAYGNSIDSNTASGNTSCGIKLSQPGTPPGTNMVSNNRTPMNNALCVANQMTQCGGAVMGQSNGIQECAVPPCTPNYGNTLCSNLP